MSAESACVADRHGTRAAYVRGCRCPESRHANTRYQTYRERRHARIAFGADDPFTVPAADAFAVLTRLRQTGWSLRRIEAASGVRRSQLLRISGSTSRPVTRVRYTTLVRLRSLLDQPPVLADGALVDAEPTWRLIHGLIALGYPKTWIAGQIGVGRAIQFQQTVTVRNARKVRDLADQIGLTRGPSDQARAFARRNGWTTDLLFDGDCDSDPVGVDQIAVERFVAGDDVTLTKDERRAAFATLIARRAPYSDICRRLGLSGQTFTSWRSDLTAESVAS